MNTVMQELFNKVYIGMHKQDFERSVNTNQFGDWVCRYRSADGMRCAVGHIIPDELYDSRMEGYSVYNLYQKFTGLPYNEPALINFMEKLQTIHDDPDLFPYQRNRAFIELAQANELEIPNVEK